MTRTPLFNFADWQSDIDWLYARSKQGDDTFHHSSVLAYFERKYGETAAPRACRVACAAGYMLRHREDFNEGKLGIAGRGEFLPGTLLIKALLFFYNRAEEDEVAKDWGVANVKAVAQSLEILSAAIPMARSEILGITGTELCPS